VNFGLSAQLVDRAVFFLLNGMIVTSSSFRLTGAAGKGAETGSAGAASGWLLSREREGDDKAKGP